MGLTRLMLRPVWGGPKDYSVNVRQHFGNYSDFYIQMN